MTATLGSGQRLSPSALAAPIACGCCLAAGTAYVVAENPSEGGAFLPCPFRTLTGWWCPGCGLTRATHHVFRGDLAQAFRYNLFVLVILGGIAAAWTFWLLDRAGRTISWGRILPLWGQVTAVAVLTAFAVLRNLPIMPGLRG